MQSKQCYFPKSLLNILFHSQIKEFNMIRTAIKKKSPTVTTSGGATKTVTATLSCTPLVGPGGDALSVICTGTYHLRAEFKNLRQRPLCCAGEFNQSSRKNSSIKVRVLRRNHQRSKTFRFLF